MADWWIIRKRPGAAVPSRRSVAVRSLQFLIFAWALTLMLPACGGDGAGSSLSPDAPISTLAYVVTRCHEGAGGGFSGSQALWVRRSDRAPVKIVEFALGQPPIGGFCTLFGKARNGVTAIFIGAFQRLGVSPDGSLVVFEVTDDFSIFSHLVPEDQQGFWAVRADGRGLQKVAEHSKEPVFSIDWRCAFPNAPGCTGYLPVSTLEFSPDGRRVGYADLGLSDSADEASQVFTLDVTNGETTQVTHLPPLPTCRGQSDDPPDCVQPTVAQVNGVSFLDERTIAYNRSRRGCDVCGGTFTVTLNTNGTPKGEPQAVRVVALPGGALIPVFEITGAEPYALVSDVPGRTPVNGGDYVTEGFVIESPDTGQHPEGRVLQVTNFDRTDTTAVRMSTDAQHVLFIASADPLGSNPSNHCQWFSIDRLGGDLRQLTSLGDAADRGPNCINPLSPGCTIFGESRIDLNTGSMVFNSTCDPLGTNPHDGNQLFALRPDGSGLRQLTQTRGIIKNADHSIDVELPGPFRVPAKLR